MKVSNKQYDVSGISALVVLIIIHFLYQKISYVLLKRGLAKNIAA